MTDEERIRRSLHDAVGEEPALLLDIDEIVIEGRRRAARVRTLLGAASATVLITALATVLPLLDGAGGPETPVAGEGPAASTTTSPGARPTARGPWPPVTTADDYHRVGQHLRGRVAEVLALRFVGAPAPSLSANTLRFGPGEDTQSWEFTGKLTTDAGQFTLTVTATVSATSPLMLDCARADSPPADLCQPFPQGSPSTTAAYGAPMSLYSVFADGTQRIDRLAEGHRLVTLLATAPSPQSRLPPEELNGIAGDILTTPAESETRPPRPTWQDSPEED